VVEIQKLIDFCLTWQVLQRVPLLGEVELEAKVAQDGVAFDEGEVVLSVMDGRHLAHGIDLSKLLALDISSDHLGLYDLVRDVAGKAERVDRPGGL
jgi:hypothetical protein